MESQALGALFWESWDRIQRNQVNPRFKNSGYHQGAHEWRKQFSQPPLVSCSFYERLSSDLPIICHPKRTALYHVFSIHRRVEISNILFYLCLSNSSIIHCCLDALVINNFFHDHINFFIAANQNITASSDQY